MMKKVMMFFLLLAFCLLNVSAGIYKESVTQFVRDVAQTLGKEECSVGIINLWVHGDKKLTENFRRELSIQLKNRGIALKDDTFLEWLIEKENSFPLWKSQIRNIAKEADLDYYIVGDVVRIGHKSQLTLSLVRASDEINVSEYSISFPYSFPYTEVEEMPLSTYVEKKAVLQDSQTKSNPLLSDVSLQFGIRYPRFGALITPYYEKEGYKDHEPNLQNSGIISPYINVMKKLTPHLSIISGLDLNLEVFNYYFTVYDYREELVFNAYDVPLYFRFDAVQGSRVTGYFFGGPYFSYASGGVSDKDRFHGITYGLMMGGGMEFSLGSGKLAIDYRMGKDLKPMDMVIYRDGYELDHRSVERTNILFGLGYSIKLK
ncbi:MAG: hypothetical protein KBS81_11305 [Spirochaetales bacterium]|nr:hypothetical protein [Candidatus Physcosoma equi]